MHYTPELLPEGYQLRTWLLNERGARTITIVSVCNPHGDSLGVGHAICNPCDKFNAERGVLIAEGRAIKSWWLRQNSA